jgi:hypothetical protein
MMLAISYYLLQAPPGSKEMRSYVCAAPDDDRLTEHQIDKEDGSDLTLWTWDITAVFDDWG